MNRCKAICKAIFYKGRLIQPCQRCRRWGRYDGLCSQHHPDEQRRRLARKIKRLEDQLAELRKRKKMIVFRRPPTAASQRTER